jgi:DNA-binding MurR/RpiR family transcriptional regulator
MLMSSNIISLRFSRMEQSRERSAATNMDGACLSKIRAGIEHASGATVKIGRFVLKRPVRARNLSIGELAKACRVSPATAFRFCRDLGYEGYKEFQLDLAAALAQNDSMTLEEFSEDRSPVAIVRQVFEYNRRSLAETARMLDIGVLERVARQLQDSRRSMFVGIGASALVARFAESRLLSLGFSALAVVDPYLQIFATENVESGDVVVGISHTGQTDHVVEAVRTARRRGARTVAITNYPQSPLAESTDLQLITAFHEHRVNAAVSSSITAQLCVINSLYFILGSWGGQDARKLADQAEERSQKLLRAHRIKQRKSTN